MQNSIAIPRCNRHNGPSCRLPFLCLKVINIMLSFSITNKKADPNKKKYRQKHAAYDNQLWLTLFANIKLCYQVISPSRILSHLDLVTYSVPQRRMHTLVVSTFTTISTKVWERLNKPNRASSPNQLGSATWNCSLCKGIVFRCIQHT